MFPWSLESPNLNETYTSTFTMKTHIKMHLCIFPSFFNFLSTLQPALRSVLAIYTFICTCKSSMLTIFTLYFSNWRNCLWKECWKKEAIPIFFSSYKCFNYSLITRAEKTNSFHYATWILHNLNLNVWVFLCTFVFLGWVISQKEL